VNKRLFKTRAGFDNFMLEQQAKGKGAAWHIMIIHDDNTGCSPRACYCKPWFEVGPLTVDAVMDGAARETAWKKEIAS
jgi:hypothetical protein